jgi:hypothetical protein
MPNWCSNSLTLSHKDPAQIKRAVDAFNNGRLLQELIPSPNGEWEYDWSVENWGTKWDVGGDDCQEPVISEDGKSADFYFDSAWAPPVQAYQTLDQNGFGVHAMYYESGMAFAGIWSDGFDDYYEFSGIKSEDVQQLLPAELDEFFAISETMAEWEDPEPLTEWYQQGVKDKELK